MTIPGLEVNILPSQYEMQSCPITIRNGTHRGIGLVGMLYPEIGEPYATLIFAGTNDTNPDQFTSWWWQPP